METYEAIMTRRSVPRTTSDALERSVVERLLEAGVRAPTHHLTQPWRFIVLAGDARKALGDAWAVAEAHREPEKVRIKPLRSPVIIAVIAKPKTHLPKVQELEEHHAVGAAIQNILLAAHDMGLGAMIRTGKAAFYQEVRTVLGVQDGEYVAGFIYLGYPEDGPEPVMTRRTPISELTEWRGM
jgi:nitroreductase